jgi:LysR family cyn operon transcriptional activator
MNLELYKIFCCVVSTGNILKASEQLYISQPAVSRAIKQLENDIGCRLFIRSSRGVKLTNQGEILYKYAKQALTFLRIGEKKVYEYENLNYGEVVVGVSDTLCKFFLTPYLGEFNNKYPNIRIQIRCHNTPETIKLLKDSLIDLALVTSPLKEESITFLPVFPIQDCFVVGEKYKFLSQKKQHLWEIISYPIILLTNTSNSRLFINNYFRDNSVVFEPAFELGNFDLLSHFAKNNFGIACVIKNFICDDLEQGKLYEIDLFEKIPPRIACIAMLNNTEPSPAAKELIKMLYSDKGNTSG